MNKMKQLVIISLLAFSIFLCTNLNVYAETTGEITTDEVRLRKNPKSDSTVLELISKGEEVEVLEQQDEWYKVKYKKITGYVHEDYIKVEENITNSNSKEENEEETKEETNDENNQEEQQIVTKLANNSNLYINPIINSLSIKELNKDVEINIISKINNWAYIEYENTYGWLLYEDIKEELKNKTEEKPQEQENPENKVEEEEEQPLNKTGYITSDGINFREEPNTDSKVIRVFIANSKVNILKEEGEWYKVTYKEQTGYVLKTYVSSKQVSTTSRSAETRTQQKENDSNVTVTQDSEKKNADTADLNNKRQEIVSLAKKYLGSKYVYGGASPSGFDCSGFTMYLYKKFGVSLPHSATAQSKVGTKVEKANLQLGDLVFFSDYKTYKGIGHVGIYIGSGKFIHASTETTGVITSSLATEGYVKRYVTATRIF